MGCSYPEGCSCSAYEHNKLQQAHDVIKNSADWRGKRIKVLEEAIRGCIRLLDSHSPECSGCRKGVEWLEELMKVEV